MPAIRVPLADQAFGLLVRVFLPGVFAFCPAFFRGFVFVVSTDDTSMALCLAASIVERHGFDAKDQMDRYLRWRDEGYMSSKGRCFGIGNTVAESLRRYESTGEPYAGPTDERTAGNGSLMRLAPVPMYLVHDARRAKELVGEMSKTTGSKTNMTLEDAS